MAKDALIHALRQISLLDGLPPLQITEIARRADRVVFKPGQTIITANQPAESAILIFSGTAERISGPGLDEPAQQLPPGSIIAEMAMLIDLTPTSTIVAKSEVRALRLTRTEIHNLIVEYPTLGEHFISKTLGRLNGIAAEMRNIERDLTTFLDKGEEPARASARATA